MKTFKQYFTENKEEVTKLTDPSATYTIKYSGHTGHYDHEYTLKDKNLNSIVNYAYVDKGGYLHSPDNDTPAIEEVVPEYSTIEHHFYNHGMLHRDGDLPAVIVKTKKKGKIIRTSYYKNGHPHRTTGPADLTFENDGSVADEMYFINGEEYTKEEFEKYIKDTKPEDREVLSDLGQTFE